MSIPLTEEQAILSHVNGYIETELSKLPTLASHLIPGIAGVLAGLALSTEPVQAELRKLTEAGVDAAVHGAIAGFNGVQAAVLDFIKSHPALEALYKALHPSLTDGQVLQLAADEAKAIMSMKLLGDTAKFRAFLGL